MNALKRQAAVCLLAVVPSACAQPTEQDETAATVASELYYRQGTILWTQNANTIPMCWHQIENYSGASEIETVKNFVKNTIRESWASYANISVTWTDCPTSGSTKHVRVKLRKGDTSFNGTTKQAGMATLSDAAQRLVPVPNDAPGLLLGMPSDWNSSNDRRDQFRALLMHEFGHVLGFLHEHDHPNGNPAASPCYDGSPDSTGLAVTGLDPASIMGWSYCVGPNSTLSTADIAGARSVYGIGPSATDWNFATQDAWNGFGVSNTARWRAGDVNGDGRSDLIHVTWGSNTIRVHTLFSQGNGTWTQTFQDAWPGFGLSDVDNWRLMDVNGDGRVDLVHLAWAASSGIRVHTLLSQGNGNWTRVFQDAWPGFGASDVGNWRAADVNGDGREDLVHIYWTAPGNVRIHTLFSNGNGTWTSQFHDAIAGFGDSDVSKWRVTDVDGDGRKDLVHVLFTNPGVRIHTLRSTGTGSFSYGFADPSPSFGASDVQNWQAGDVDGDGKNDLVHVMWTSLNGGQIRAHTLFSKGFNQWSFAYHDAWSGFGSSDVDNWRVMDANGDGKVDLVHVYWSSPGNIRVHSLFSNGSGRWTSEFRDAISGFGATDVKSWRPIRVDSNARMDLFHVMWTAPGTVRVHSLRSQLPMVRW